MCWFEKFFCWQFRQHLKDVFCGLTSSSSVMVCCSKNFVSSEHHCPHLEEEPKKTATCGRRFSTFSHIAGGNKTNPGDWPWMARLLYKDPRETFEKTTFCGGTLISRHHVVTAGHCITEEVAPVAVALGDSDVTTDYDCLDADFGCQTNDAACATAEECAPKHIEIAIRDIIINNKYTSEDCFGCIPNYDVALIILERPVTFTDFIQPACLPNPTGTSKGPLVVTGWGNTMPGYGHLQSASILQEINVDQVSLTECKEKCKPKLRDNLITFHMCASTGVEDSATCKGDSGGPLVRNIHFLKQIWELTGVVSFGTSTCGNVDYPLVFTRIEGEVNIWLRNLVGRDLPGHP